MKKLFITALLGAAVMAGSVRVNAADTEKKPKVFPADFGPSTIDVSGFPKDLQPAYPLFQNKCAQCHTLSRPVNSAYAGDDWRLYVNQMRHKPGSGINKRNADKIIAFLQYWSANRVALGWKAPVVSKTLLAAAEAAGSATAVSESAGKGEAGASATPHADSAVSATPSTGSGKTDGGKK